MKKNLYIWDYLKTKKKRYIITMIRQIQANGYMKRVASMTEAERLDLAKRVGEW